MLNSLPPRRRIALAMESPLMQQGGIEALVRVLLAALSNCYEVVLVTADQNRDELPEDFSKLILTHESWIPSPPSSVAGRALAASLLRHGIQLAHFHFGMAFDWASDRFWRCPAYHLAGTGVPCLATNHSTMQWLNCGVRPDRPLWQKHLFQLFAIFSRSLLYKRLQYEICVSKQSQRQLQRVFPIFRSKIIQRYHSLLSAQAPPHDSSPRDIVVLCVGTIANLKGQPILAEAFARIADRYPGWRLDFIGRTAIPADEQRVRACARLETGNRMRLLGPMDHQRTLALMQRASVFVLPSFCEGLPLALQEALSCQCACLATNIPGSTELVEDGINGLLVPAGDVSALAQALDRLLADSALRQRLTANSALAVQHNAMTAPQTVA
jgi:glycosyltransferase involved in cell wall biosynthesis